MSAHILSHKVLVLGGLLSTLAFAQAAWADEPAKATPKAQSPRQCFYSSNMSSFKDAGDQAVYIRVGNKDLYRLDLFGTCHDLRWAQTLGVESRGSSWICSGISDAVLIVPSTLGPERCPVTGVTKLTDAEIEALPRKDRP
jgi:hypothetical protein